MAIEFMILICMICFIMGALLMILTLDYMENEVPSVEDPPPLKIPDRYVMVRKAIGPLRFDTIWKRYEEWLEEQGLTVEDVYGDLEQRSDRK